MTNKVYDYVTERIVKMLEEGKIPWRKPWDATGTSPRNLVSKKPYRGINFFLTAYSDYASPYWLTMNQVRKLKGSVKKGEHATMVVFYKTLTYKKDTEDEKNVPFLRYYNVFNLEQCDGIEAPKETPRPAFVPVEKAESILLNMPDRPSISYGGGRACYSPSLDKVSCPNADTFTPHEEFYCTMFHELAHSTGHSKRLKRFPENQGASLFATESYSKEELIAEMTAAFLCAESGIENAVIENAAAYIQGWKSRITSDPKFIVQAANAAQKAADFILNKKKEEEVAAE